MTNQPAYPCKITFSTPKETVHGLDGMTAIVGGEEEVEYAGMTLRQYYAAKAMVGLIQSNDFFNHENKGWYLTAKASFDIADALIKFEEDE